MRLRWIGGNHVGHPLKEGIVYVVRAVFPNEALSDGTPVFLIRGNDLKWMAEAKHFEPEVDYMAITREMISR